MSITDSIVVCRDYAEMSRKAAEVFADYIKKNPHGILGLATGSSPEGLYDCLVEKYEKGELDFSGITSYNLDEYYPITPDNDHSYRYFMDRHLFDRVISTRQIHMFRTERQPIPMHFAANMMPRSRLRAV